MTDIVERLRTKHILGVFEIERLRQEAADEIERLRSKTSMADGMLALSGLNVDIHATDIAVMKSTIAKLIAAEKEIERLRNVAQGAMHPSLLKAMNDLHVWLEIEGCCDQVEIINDAFSAAGITEYRCANCDGAGEWDEGPLPATSSTQISPDYRHMVCSDCEGKGTISLSSAERGCICQEQHRRGYCIEPRCPHAQHHRQP